MGEDNVATLRALFEDWGREPWTPEAWERGDVIDLSFFAPDVVYEDTILPDHGDEAYHGHEGMIRAARRWIEGTEWLQIKLEEISGEGDRLVSTQIVRSKARHTGIELPVRFAYDWTFRDGKVVHFRSFIPAGMPQPNPAE
jgi:ketosteroid isomerase-like protein